MTQGERIREVRKTLGLTLEKFGEKIGMKKNSVSQIENGKNSVTEQVVKSICREFNVDYIWLTTGDGEMFVDTDDDFIERIDRIMAGEDDARKNLFKALLEVDDEDRENGSDKQNARCSLFALKLSAVFHTVTFR